MTNLEALLNVGTCLTNMAANLAVNPGLAADPKWVAANLKTAEAWEFWMEKFRGDVEANEELLNRTLQVSK